MDPSKCCVPSCKNTNADTVLQNFPNPEKEINRYSIWMHAIGGKFLEADPISVYEKARICNIHFEQKCFTATKKLSKYSVPSLNLPDPQSCSGESEKSVKRRKMSDSIKSPTGSNPREVPDSLSEERWAYNMPRSHESSLDSEDEITPQEIRAAPATTRGSNNSTVAAESGRSNICNEVDVKVERTTQWDDSASESEEDSKLLDISLLQSVSDNPMEVEEMDPSEDAIHREGAEADFAIRAMADSKHSDLMVFDWREDCDNFEGVRETFTGPSGPTFAVAGLTPLEVLRKIWTDDIIEHIVRQTNRYAHQARSSKSHSKMTGWTDTNTEEIWGFLAIIMYQSFALNNVEKEYWYPNNEQLRMGDFEKIISYNRFKFLKRFIHFVDNDLLENPSKLDKVMPIIQHLNEKFSSLYLPEQTVAISESILHRRRLHHAASRTRVGVKSYGLCESKTGYLWRMEVSGKGQRVTPRLGNKPETATSQVVYRLIKPLLGKGHTIVMDRCNAPLLSRILKSIYRTDTIGTLRLDREFVPNTLKCKSMGVREVCYSTTKDLSVVLWRDKTIVSMISTFHKPDVGKEDQPKIVQDYNLFTGLNKDSMLRAYPINLRNASWYKRLFCRLLNLSIHNAMVIYNHKTQRTERDFRLQLLRQLLCRREVSGRPQDSVSQLHMPAKNEKRQRCRFCREGQVRRSTAWRCATCQVNLCVGCFSEYHAKYVVI